METKVSEIADGIYRLSTYIPDIAPPAGFTFNQFCAELLSFTMSGSKIWEDSMKTYVVTMASAIFVSAASIAYAASTTVTINAIDANGVGKKIGTIELSDTNEGLRITPQLTELPPGDHGFHVHVNPNCGPANGPNGQPAAGMAAGGHYDPANTGKHLGPQGEGHKGDMPVLTVEASGKATKAVTAPHLTLADVKGRSIMIHAGGDNYSDQPASLGGGGARIACGVAI
jgi:superoxide dismutase, Cu-Zn family